MIKNDKNIRHFEIRLKTVPEEHHAHAETINSEFTDILVALSQRGFNGDL